MTLHSVLGKLALFFQIAINRRDRGDRREDVYYIPLSLRYLYRYSLLCEPGVPGGRKTGSFCGFFAFFGRFCVLFARFVADLPREIRFTRYEIRDTRYSPPDDGGSAILISALWFCTLSFDP